MTDKTFTSNRRAVLIVVAVAILVLLASTLSYFAENPSLVSHNTVGSAAPSASPANGTPSAEGMNEATQQHIMALMQKLQQNPTDLEALIGLAEHFMGMQEWQKAETFALRAVVAAPNETQPLYMLGIIQHSQNRNAEAAASLEKVVAAKDEPSVRYSLGILYAYYLNQPDKGLEHLQKALANPAAPDDLKKAIADEIGNIKKHKEHEQQKAQ